RLRDRPLREGRCLAHLSPRRTEVQGRRRGSRGQDALGRRAPGGGEPARGRAPAHRDLRPGPRDQAAGDHPALRGPLLRSGDRSAGLRPGARRVRMGRLLAWLVLGGTVSVSAQESAQKTDYLVGEAVMVDATGRKLTVKCDGGGSVEVTVPEAASLLRAAP